jgi:ABC-type dipeptide/oligopeptide/nickel transport system permease subunit
VAVGTIPLEGEQYVAPPQQSRLRTGLRLARSNPLGTIGLLIVLAFIVAGSIGPMVTPYDPRHTSVEAQLQGPSQAHPFGANGLGQDVLSRVLAGARLSLVIGAAAVLLGVVGGSLIGIASGYFGGAIDSAIQRTGEAGAAFPGLLLYLTLIAAIGRGMDTIIIGLAISGLIGGSRVLRALTLVIKTSPFVEAARAAGATELRILITHIIPNVVPIVIVIASSAWGGAILAEAALSFLGIGVEVGTPSWGADLSGANLTDAQLGHWYLVIFPGAALSLVVLGFNLLGDTLRDILDPRLRGSLR